MRYWRYVFYHAYLKACALECTDSRLSACAWTLYVYFNSFHAMLDGGLCRCLGC